MILFEKMISESADKDVKRKLTLAGYLYREIETEQNSEMLQELVSLIMEVFGTESAGAAPKRDVASKRKFDSKILQDFYDYMLSLGMEPSTSYDYCRRIDRIVRDQGISIEDLAQGKVGIQTLIDKYLKGDGSEDGGPEKRQNERQHKGPSSALKKFKQYIDRAFLNG